MKENLLNFHDLVLALTVIECFCMAVLIKVLPDRHVHSRRIIASFFVVVALVLISTLIVWNRAFSSLAINQSFVMIVIFVACLLLQGPLLYLYIRSLRSNNPNLTRRDLLHLLPVLICCGLIIIFNINTPDWRGVDPLPGIRQDVLSWLWMLVKFSPFIYVMASVILRYRIYQHVRRGASAISDLELTLGDAILIGFLIHWVWTLATYFVADWVHWSVNDTLGIINNYSIIVLINGLFLAGLFNAEKLLHPEPVIADKSASVKDKEKKIAIIEKAMQEDKLYLESNLNIDRFAERLGLRVRDVSTIIKIHYGTNFFDFINKYRIDEVKRLLLQEEYKNDTILDIIYKAGFNSLSTFHRFFKRMVGVTPTEYRRQGGMHQRDDNDPEAVQKV